MITNMGKVLEYAVSHSSNSKSVSTYLDCQEVDSSVKQVEKPEINNEKEMPSSFFRECVAEAIGTSMIVLFGNGAVAQAVLNPAAKGSSYLTINLGFGLGLMLGVYIAGPISGAHLNPAITLAHCCFRKFSWKKLPGYAISQFIGAFLGACLVMLTCFPALNDFDGGIRHTIGEKATASIFGTLPPSFVPNYAAFFIELVSTFMLIFGILAITDPKHKTPSWLAPIGIGGVITAIAMSMGWLTGFALNPARDFGPRLFTSLAGWGSAPFSAHGYYFFVPIIAPCLGAIAGMQVYDILISPKY